MLARLVNILRARVLLPLARRWRYFKLKRLTGCGRVGRNVVIGKDVIIWTTGGVEIGDNVCLRSGVQIYEKHKSRVILGDGVHLDHQCIVSSMCGITIGEGTLIGYRAIIVDNDHRYDLFSLPFQERGHTTGPITIGKGVWIGAQAVILKGVTIGDGAVVGANSVVTRDVPPRAVVAGAPAREIERRTPTPEAPPPQP
ncbi:MAG: acyltransferase [Planctomycetota bacterium]